MCLFPTPAACIVGQFTLYSQGYAQDRPECITPEDKSTGQLTFDLKVAEQTVGPEQIQRLLDDIRLRWVG